MIDRILNFFSCCNILDGDRNSAEMSNQSAVWTHQVKDECLREELQLMLFILSASTYAVGLLCAELQQGFLSCTQLEFELRGFSRALVQVRPVLGRPHRRRAGTCRRRRTG